MRLDKKKLMKGMIGVTIANEFSLTYPQQFRNVSFGLDPNGSQVYFSPSTPASFYAG